MKTFWVSQRQDVQRSSDCVSLQAVDVEFGYARHGVSRGHERDSNALVLRGVSLTIENGAIVGLLGPNGSGKTTLLKLLSGGLRPTAGSITLDEKPLAQLSRRQLARRLAVVPQETHTAFDYTVEEMVLMGRYAWLGAFEVEGPADRAAALAALEATGAAHLASRPFGTLSGGEKQRVIIASALAQLDNRANQGNDPGNASRPLLFLDEPTTSLDLKYQLEIVSLVGRLHESQGMTIVMSTHDLRLAAHFCHSVVLLRAGRVMASGPTAETLTASRVGELYHVDERLVAPLIR
jgi:iron complex transport system ATP-binding protein